MTSRCQISVTISSALFEEVNNVAKAENVSLDKLVVRAIEALLELEHDTLLQELVRARDTDPEIEVSLDDLVADISDSNIHGKND